MLNLAIKVAEANPIVDLPRMAAILSYKGEVMSIGLNKRKTHPLQKKYSKNAHSLWLHAEIDCIRNALRSYSRAEISNFTLHVARLRKDSLPAKAKPCTGCQRALEDYGITKVIWTDDPQE